MSRELFQIEYQWLNEPNLEKLFVFWNAAAKTINTATLNERELKTCIPQRSKWLTRYNMGGLSFYFGFKYFVPLSDCQQIVQTLAEEKIIME